MTSRGIILGYVGHVEKGRRLLAEALLAMEASNQGNRLAEAYRLQGKLLLRQATPDVAQAEACFQQAWLLPATSRPSPGSCGPP